MNYESVILNILREAGDTGMPLRRIALNVFNLTNSLFNPIERENVYNDVAEWLRSESSKSGACIEKAETRGWYRLNNNSSKVQQMMMEFQPKDEDMWMM